MTQQLKYNLKVNVAGLPDLKIPCKCGSQSWGMVILPIYMSCSKEHDHDANDEPVIGMRFLECLVCGRSRVWERSREVQPVQQE